MRIDDFKKLRVYQDGLAAALEIFALSKAWPKEEQYALPDQVRRSSRSVCANIGEAWFKRRYPKHFASKLSDAGSEALETLVWIDIAVASGYLERDRADELNTKYRGIAGGIVKMMANPDQWCVPSSQVREDTPEYIAGL